MPVRHLWLYATPVPTQRLRSDYSPGKKTNLGY